MRLRAAAAATALGLLTAVLLAAGGVSAAGRSGLLLVAAHALLAVGATVLLLPRISGRVRRCVGILGMVAAGAALASVTLRMPSLSRVITTWLHVAAGAGLLGILVWACAELPAAVNRRRTVLASTAVLLLLGVYGGAEVRRFAWSPPRYDSEACYRFLTATTPQQAGMPHFPSALQAGGTKAEGCQDGGCHTRVHERWQLGAHATGAASPAYRRTYGDFTTRRGETAGKWCRGCHQPETLAVGNGGASRAQGIECGACHRAETVHALYGAAALRLRGVDAPADRLAARVRPRYHAAANLRAELHRSAEFCGSCHRKNWNLPQNDYHWMPGPDELGQWQGSRYGPGALLASGDRATKRDCLSCHSSPGAGHSAPPAERSGLRLDLFVRSGVGGRQVHLADEAAFASGDKLLLDVVVQNTGIGHDFPTGMPDLQEAWLEVTLSDPSGRRVSGSGVTGPATGSDPGAHTYRLVPLDRSGQPLRHGELDRWASTAEWRRIPAGGADLARYALTAPRGGGTLRFRLLRRRRPDFSRWAGEPVQTAPQILAELTQPLPGPGAVTPGAQSQAARWRAYGNALAGVKNFPQALAALRTASELDPADVETVLALGRVYLDEGDLLDAREQFRKAQASDAERGQAWEAAVLRRMGQPDQAAVLLKPLVRRYPRDARLRFELASAYMAALRNEDAAREFEAVLDVDPTNDRAHFSLMFCLQRLNRLTAARREETIYRLLRPETVTAAGKAGATEDRPLHVHPLEPAR